MAYVVSKRSAVNSVVSMVMFAVLRLMVNFSYETKCINKKNRKKKNYKQLRFCPKLRCCFLTLVFLLTGFPRSHSTWEPF